MRIWIKCIIFMLNSLFVFIYLELSIKTSIKVPKVGWLPRNTTSNSVNLQYQTWKAMRINLKDPRRRSKVTPKLTNLITKLREWWTKQNWTRDKSSVARNTISTKRRWVSKLITGPHYPEGIVRAPTQTLLVTDFQKYRGHPCSTIRLSGTSLRLTTQAPTRVDMQS